MSLLRISQKALYRSTNVRLFSSVLIPQDKQWFLFPREREGNIYSDNWSLTHDGLVPVNDAYRNARVGLLLSHLPSKVTAGKIEIPKITYNGKYTFFEAGDNIPHDVFSELFTNSQEYLSSCSNIYVEDAGVIAQNTSRIPIRIVTDNPAVAIIARSLLIPMAPRPPNPMAKYDGWKFNPRHSHKYFLEGNWKGDHFEMSKKPTEGGKGQRPIVAYIGAPGSDVAVQYIEKSGKLVGANIVVGLSAPIESIINAVGSASVILSNESSTETLAIKSVVITKGAKTTVIVNGPESLAIQFSGDKGLYGAYHNLLSTSGVSAFWNGVISSSFKPNNSLPSIVSQGKSVELLTPDNAVNPASTIIFFEDGAPKASLSEDEAAERLVKYSDGKKTGAAKNLVAGVKSFTVGRVEDVAALL